MSEHCDYCGSLDWTVEKYGRVTHKQECPHRSDAWSQLHPNLYRVPQQLGPEIRNQNNEGV